MTTQVAHIRAHLEDGKSITPAHAIAVYGIFRLSSVIEDLRLTGMPIDCVLKYDEVGKQYGEYRIRRPIVFGSLVQVKRGHAYGLPMWVRRLKAARVIATREDASLVRFICGRNTSDEWMNNQELLRAD